MSNGFKCAYEIGRNQLEMSMHENYGKMEIGGFSIPAGWNKTIANRMQVARWNSTWKNKPKSTRQPPGQIQKQFRSV